MRVLLTQSQKLELARAIIANRETYHRHCRSSANSPVDWLVLTSANEHQAVIFRRELAYRQKSDFFPRKTQVLVVCDPPKKRVGSGGATVRALAAIQRKVKSLTGLRVMIIHAANTAPQSPRSGSPNILFSPLPVGPTGNQHSTLFDEVFITLCCVLARLGPAVLVASGDVFTVFYTKQVVRAVSGVTGLAIKTPVEQASHHGVYVSDQQGTVQRFLHKRDEDLLRMAGAQDAFGRAWVDTGILVFAGRGLEALSSLAKTAASFNLYDDLAPALAAGTSQEAYLAVDRSTQAVRQHLWSAFHGLRFQVQKLVPALFFHLGSSKEYSDAFAPGGPIKNVLRLGQKAYQTDLELAQMHSVFGSEGPTDGVLQSLLLRSGAQSAQATLARLAAHSTPLVRARVEHAHSKLLVLLAQQARSVVRALKCQREADVRETAAFSAVADSLGAVQLPSAPSQLAIAPDKEVCVSLPVRVDFGGGWSDTPPHSLERGGVVLNAAVLLEGKHPIRVTARALQEPEIWLESRDLATRRLVESTDEVIRYHDPSDPFALHKAALVLAGIVQHGSTDLRTRLQQFGGGIELITESAVPKGSGLGTSSIMGACLMSALCRVCGEKNSTDQLIEKVLRLEQMLTTGGGWQDQVGGLVPGIKLISAEKGIPQRLQIDQVNLPHRLEEELQRRLVLVYVGRRRLAKNILRTVMGRYLAREPEVLYILDRIQDIAREMRRALVDGDLDGFGLQMREHWELNKRLDPKSTNAEVEKVLNAAKPFAIGYKMVGAGGGGFAEIVARTERDAKRIANAMPAVGARVYQWSLELHRAE